MRTKVLLGLAALAVGLSTSVAQNVYSLNVVGYVNVSLQQNKLSFLSLPLAPVDGNYAVGNTIVLDSGNGAQDFANLYSWNVASQSWNPALTWLSGAWDTPSQVISNGVGFFIVSVTNSTLTFVGQVPQGALQYNVPAGVSTLANQVPVSTNFPGSGAAFLGHDFDNLYTWDQAGQQWGPGATFLSGAWDTASPNGPMLNPGDAVFYVNGGAAIPFTQNFTVQ
jgi:hypothetical protein